jgi:3-oxoacyl-[acyl-carrier protein] reductase
VKLTNKVSIVTGAAQGIGAAYAFALADEGAKVAFVDLKLDEAEENAERARKGGADAIAVRCDVSDEDSVNAMVSDVTEAFGGVDILVNNASIYEGYVRYTWQDLPLDYWQRFLDVNLTSVLLCTKAVVPSMIGRGGGKIINQSSASGAKSPNHYGVTKLAVQGLTVGFAKEFGQYNICVNCIAPGVITTAATLGSFDEQALENMRRTMTVLGRLGTVEDMANTLIYLASSDSDFLTGQVLHVDGGQIMNPL